jgi:hypothetical protein
MSESEGKWLDLWLDRVAGAVGFAVLIIVMVAYSWTVRSGPVFSEEVVTVVSTWITTDRPLNEPLASTFFWLIELVLFACLVGLLLLLHSGTRRTWKWWKSRTSRSSINGTLLVKLQVTNDSQDFKNTRQAIQVLERKHGPLTIGFLTWLNNKPPREVSVLSINEVEGQQGYTAES